MSIEEFLNRLDRLEEIEVRYKKMYEQYSSRLPPELTEVVFKHLPVMNKHRTLLEPKVYEVAEKYISEVWEAFNMAYSYDSIKRKKREFDQIKKPQTREEAEIELQERLTEIHARFTGNDIPKGYVEYCIEAFWESYEESYAREVYVYSVYEKMKEVFTEVYLEDILKFNSDNLRYFDSSIYLMCCCKFTEDIWELYEMIPNPKDQNETGVGVNN